MKQIILVDAKNCCYRAHFKHMNLSSRGRSTSVIYGMTSMLLGLKKKLNAQMIIVWDGYGETWRHKLTKNRKRKYKGNRQFDATRKTVNEQAQIVKEFLTSLGVLNVEVPSVEADDLIGILSRYLVKQGYNKVIIYSGDRDYFQLLSDKIVIYSAQGNRQGMILTRKKMEKIWKVSPNNYVKMRALCGDKSDNISNVIRGIGSVTARKLLKDGLDPSLKEFNQHLEKAFNKHSDKFAPIWELVHENYKLCKILREIDRPLDERTQKLIFKTVISACEKKVVSTSTYREVIEFLVSYELDELFDRRKELWNLSK